jgi:hypothetical protein
MIPYTNFLVAGLFKPPLAVRDWNFINCKDELGFRFLSLDVGGRGMLGFSLVPRQGRAPGFLLFDNCVSVGGARYDHSFPSRSARNRHCARGSGSRRVQPLAKHGRLRGRGGAAAAPALERSGVAGPHPHGDARRQRAQHAAEEIPAGRTGRQHPARHLPAHGGRRSRRPPPFR